MARAISGIQLRRVSTGLYRVEFAKRVPKSNRPGHERWAYTETPYRIRAIYVAGKAPFGWQWENHTPGSNQSGTQQPTMDKAVRQLEKFLGFDVYTDDLS